MADILTAVREGNKEQLRTLIASEGFSETTDGGYTLLLEAIRRRNDEMVRMLITSGAKVNTERKQQNLIPADTPLHMAIIDRKMDIAEMLLNKGADINVTNNSCETSVDKAIKTGRLEFLELLFNRGVDLNARGPHGYRPLHIAVIAGNKDAVVLLLSYGADIDAKHSNNKTALCFAAKESNLGVLKLLLQFKPDVNNAGNKKALYLAMNTYRDGCKMMVESLLGYGFIYELEAGCDPKFFHGAIELGFLEIVEDLLTYGADANMDLYGVKPLLLAIKTALLLDKGANVNARCGKNECSPRRASSANGDHRGCETLLRKGVAVVSKNIQGRTPLHCAVRAEIVKTLIHSGADIDAQDLEGLTPLHIAVIDVLSKIDADVYLFDKKGEIALHLACRTLQAPTVRLLLDFGADINICDNYNATAMTGAYSYFCERFDREFHCDPQRFNQVKFMIKELFFHIDKMEMINLYVSDKNLAVKRQAQDFSFLSEDVFTKQRQHCKEEIGKLQATKINNYNVTYYDFLTKNTSSLAVLLGNDSILQVFQPESANAEEFPNFAPLLKMQFRKAMERKGLVEQCYEIFGFLCHELPLLPTCCVEKIFQYFSNEDLKMFVTVRGPPRQCSTEEELMDKVIYDSLDDNDDLCDRDCWGLPIYNDDLCDRDCWGLPNYNDDLCDRDCCVLPNVFYYND